MLDDSETDGRQSQSYPKQVAIAKGRSANVYYAVSKHMVHYRLKDDTWELKQEGWQQKDTAEALGVTPGAISQWIKRAREKGAADLKRKIGTGTPRRLSDEQLAELPDLLRKGAEHFGFRGDVWTRKRVAAVIRQEFEVSYSERHVRRILKSIGWTRQKPIHRASECNWFSCLLMRRSESGRRDLELPEAS